MSTSSPPPDASDPAATPPTPANGEAPEPTGIPTSAEGSQRATADFDEGAPVGPTPACDFWDAIYSRRSIRKFQPDPVPRELVDQLMHAGIWAPSSCNYQMWDLVAVDDPEVNAKLAALSLQMSNAPVNIIVSYGRDFSEEAWANIQSASALIQNMSLAAGVLGLGTFWITQMGNAEKVREAVGLPYDRLVIAVLAVGYPKFQPKKGPKRRPLGQVTHWNHYAGKPIPSNPDPALWEPELVAIYQRARVLNGLRHNKPRPWEVRAIERVLERFVPKAEELPSAEGEVSADGPPRWLDVLPCTGIVTERLSRQRKGWAFDICERTPEVAAWVAARTRPKAGTFGWPDASPELESPQANTYDLATCLFRLEGLPREQRAQLLADIQSWLKPGGTLLIGFVSRRSFHDWTERARARRGGPRGVEYVLSPDPNVGPFESLVPGEVEDLARAAGFEVQDRLGLQAVPQPEEIDFRTRNFGPRWRRVAGLMGRALGSVDALPGVESRRGRFQFLRLRRRS